MNFVAIDFETANEQRASACALGIVVVENGCLVEERSLLIRPPELRFNRFNTRLHGIGEGDVETEPDFFELWPEIEPYFSGRTVIAHNAVFDMSVLRGMLDVYRIDHPELRYACTMRMARRAWPYLGRYRLGTVAEHLTISFVHHDALEDARVCALIALRAGQEIAAASFDELATRLDVGTGTLSDRFRPAGHLRGARALRRARFHHYR